MRWFGRGKHEVTVGSSFPKTEDSTSPEYWLDDGEHESDKLKYEDGESGRDYMNRQAAQKFNEVVTKASTSLESLNGTSGVSSIPIPAPANAVVVSKGDSRTSDGGNTQEGYVWDGSLPWAEHENPVVVPPVEPVDPPEEAICGAMGLEEGQVTKCILAPDHSYKNGNRSPHKGTVTVTRTWPNTTAP